MQRAPFAAIRRAATAACLAASAFAASLHSQVGAEPTAGDVTEDAAAASTSEMAESLELVEVVFGGYLEEQDGGLGVWWVGREW
jgi:hypothetical protein